MSSKMSGSDSDSEDGAEPMDWLAYTKYKPHKNAISFFKKLGYKDIDADTWKPEEEPRMNVFTAGRETKTLELDRHVSIRKALCYFNVAGKETFYRLLPIIEISKNLHESPIKIDPSTVADLICAVGFSNSGHTTMPEDALEAQRYGTQVFRSKSGSGMRATALRLDSFSGGFADWPEWKPMTVATLQMSGHYRVATDPVVAQMNPDLNIQLYGMLSRVLLMKGCTASWLLDAPDDFKTAGFPCGHKLWKRIEENYETKQFITACLVLENKLQTSLTMKAWHELQHYLDEWVATRKRTMEAYRIQYKNKWGNTEQQKNSDYFITSFATGINGPSELRATVTKAVDERNATWASVLLAVREEHLRSEHGKKGIAKMHGKPRKADDSAEYPDQESNTPPSHKPRKETLYSSQQMMELFKNASSSSDVSQEQLAKMASSLKGQLNPKGSSNRQRKKENVKRKRFEHRKKRRKKNVGENPSRGDLSGIRTEDLADGCVFDKLAKELKNG